MRSLRNRAGFPAVFPAVCLAAALSAGGCGKGDVKDFVPAEEAARSSLAAALEAWKSGLPHEKVSTAEPPVEVLDTQWKEGKKLTGYEILGKEPSEDQNQRFRVRLTLADGTVKESVYVVLGKQPIWVFNADDYQRASGM